MLAISCLSFEAVCSLEMLFSAVYGPCVKHCRSAGGTLVFGWSFCFHSCRTVFPALPTALVCYMIQTTMACSCARVFTHLAPLVLIPGCRADIAPSSFPCVQHGAAYASICIYGSFVRHAISCCYIHCSSDHQMQHGWRWSDQTSINIRAALDVIDKDA